MQVTANELLFQAIITIPVLSVATTDRLIALSITPAIDQGKLALINTYLHRSQLNQ